jgi:hypothetical protein
VTAMNIDIKSVIFELLLMFKAFASYTYIDGILLSNIFQRVSKVIVILARMLFPHTKFNVVRG